MKKILFIAVMLVLAAWIFGLGGQERIIIRGIAGPGKNPPQKAVDESLGAAPEGKVDIRIISGSISVTGTEGTQVLVTGTVGSDIEKVLVEDKGDNLVTVSLKYPDLNNLAHLELKCSLEIMVPSGSSLSVGALNADILVRDVTGSLAIETMSGSISVTGSPNLIQAGSMNGPISVDGPVKRVRFQTMAGKVTLTGIQEEVYGSTMDGDIRIETSGLKNCELSTMSGDIFLGGSYAADARIKATARLGGAIRLSMPVETEALFTLACPSGSLDLSGFKPEAAIDWIFRDGEPGAQERPGASGREGSRFPFSFRFGEFILDKFPGGRGDKTILRIPQLPNLSFAGAGINEFSLGSGAMRVYLETGFPGMRGSGQKDKKSGKAAITIVTE